MSLPLKLCCAEVCADRAIAATVDFLSFSLKNRQHQTTEHEHGTSSHMCRHSVSTQTSDSSQQAHRVWTLRDLHEPELPSDQRHPVRLQKHWWERETHSTQQSVCVGELLLYCLSTSADVVSTPSAGNNVLIVAHASSLEACTRQLQGRGPQSAKDFIQVVRKVCSLHICVFYLVHVMIL